MSIFSLPEKLVERVNATLEGIDAAVVDARVVIKDLQKTTTRLNLLLDNVNVIVEAFKFAMAQQKKEG